MPSKEFVRKQWGNCCLSLLDAYSPHAHPQDMEHWKKLGRDDILAWVLIIPTAGSPVYDLWTSPITGEEVERCPWLRKLPNKNKYVCRIHEVKPKHCRQYPQSKKHGKDTGCKGFDK